MTLRSCEKRTNASGSWNRKRKSCAVPWPIFPGTSIQKMMYPLVRELAARDAPIRVPVAVSCLVLNFARQAYYQWAANTIPSRDWEEAHLINAAPDHHRDDPAFGYRFIADEINAGAGPEVSERRIWRLCSQNGILSVIHRRRRSGLKAGPPVHDDLIERDFSATAPNRKWLTDITEHHTAEGKLYLCAIKDLHSNRIVGYSMDGRMKASLAVAALDHAVALRKPAGTVVHSDRGSQGVFNRSKQQLLLGLSLAGPRRLPLECAILRRRAAGC